MTRQGKLCLNLSFIPNAYSKTGQVRRDVQKWLCPASVQDDLARHEAECMSGSCEWALATPALRNFLVSEVSETLRIGGAPGSGKSTLAAFIVNHIKHTVTGDVLYFFCKGTQEKKMKPFQVLRTLISQLLSRDDSLYPWFETLYQQSGQKEAESIASLQHSFQLALRNTAKPIIYIVVDALDECQEAQRLAPFLMSASKHSNKPVKLIVTSRDDHELLDSFQEPFNELIIAPENVRGLVSYYIKDRVSRCKRINQSHIRDQIHVHVAMAADGLWLFARLMMDEIDRLPSAASIARQLQHIPNGVARLYKQIFETMEKGFSPLQLRLSQQAFLWLNMSTFVRVGRPRLDREILDLLFEAETSGEKVFDSIQLAQELCSPLITLFIDENEYLQVDVIHHTAAQFIRQCSEDSARDVPEILKPQRLKALYHGTTSAWYFSLCPQSTELLKYLRNTAEYETFADTRAYFEMAYGLWDAFFLRKLPDCLESDFIHEATRLCDKMTGFLISEACLKWVEMAIIINYSGGYFQLIDNARKALKASKRGVAYHLPAFQQYSLKRREFFADYVYVLALTGPSYDSDGSDDSYTIKSNELIRPDGFENRPFAMRILSLGKIWASHKSASDICKWQKDCSTAFGRLDVENYVHRPLEGQISTISS